eukprot:3381854-Amphidinium_carterae.1
MLLRKVWLRGSTAKHDQLFNKLFPTELLIVRLMFESRFHPAFAMKPSCWADSQGDVNVAEDVAQLYFSACDAPIRVPFTRYDLDEYWAEEDEPGKMYVQHFGLLSAEQMGSFDAEFYGFSQEEAYQTAPPARKALETAYETLYRAGWTRQLLKGTSMTVSSACMSDIDYQYLYGTVASAGVGANTYLRSSATTTSNRLQYIF